MALSNDLLSQFAKEATSHKKVELENVVYGTVVEYEGKNHVRLDGSDMLTPMSSTVSAEPGERVAVRIKNHSATVTGNLSSPAARVGTVEEIEGKTSVYIDEIRGELVEYQKGVFDELEAIDARFINITAENAEFHKVVTDDLEAKQVVIDELEAKTAEIENLDTKFANIDFANIGEASFKKIFSGSGLIKDLVVGNGTVTGEFVGVTISGDLVKANTLKADKIVVKGSDGLYYKLNVTEGGIAPSEQVTEEDLQNGLHGSNIIAKTITAEKVSVDDLVAFDAKLANFTIGLDESGTGVLYSGVKESIENTTEGVYLDSDGQMNVGGTSQYLKYYKTEDGTYRLEIAAESIVLGASGKDVEEIIDNTQTATDDNTSRLANVEATLQILEDAISMLVTDDNGSSLMTQTSDGWTFNISNIQSALNNTSENLSDLIEEFGSIDAVIAEMQRRIDELGGLAEYVRIGTYEYVDEEGITQTEPCIELGESDSEFKQRITNTKSIFLDGINAKTSVSKDGILTENIEVTNELKVSGSVEVTDDGDDTYISKVNYIWKVRKNGNCGMIYDGWLG